MKIGLISTFDDTNINYGGEMQIYALSSYLMNVYPHVIVEILFFEKSKWKRTCYLGAIGRKCYHEFEKLINKKNSKSYNMQFVHRRLDQFIKFRDEVEHLRCRKLDWERLLQSDYDLFIVGSDVVWSQDRFSINRIFFLDFSNLHHARKASYAASFGRERIPFVNRMYLQKCLRNFYGISVREKSSVDLLKTIGINNAVHTLDPTLLLAIDKWERLERRPIFQATKKMMDFLDSGAYLFAYILGDDEQQRKDITRICKENGLLLITIPFICGKWIKADETFGDIRLKDCSPGEWIWLIHHAEFIITDSFHGIVFSTIFSKKFLAVKRYYNIDINVRQKDYLDTIHQEDKMVNLAKVKDLGRFQWDYEKINRLLTEKKEFSKNYINYIIN